MFKKLAEKVVKKVTEKKLELEDVQPILQELETGLIESDVAVEVSEKITGDLKNALVGGEIKRGKEKEAVTDALRKSLLGILSVPEINLEDATREKKPFVILFLGFNGAGKTTTIAKVGKWLMDKGHTVVFAAGDTWRKAAIEQLEEHGKALNVNVIKHTYGADPAAVIYDGIEHAKARGIDVLLADSAGRTHVNQNLINELKKVVRVAKPDLKVLVMDSLVGNDAVEQAKMFNEAVGVDAVVFTKLDVNQKGGAILSVTHLLKKPVLFLGTGQEYEKLIKFDSTKFVDELLI
ncbi:signal recognition particle-docking protein FtsY [archaeon]|nr:MAG: signal recognition particle-docking protein FtsY [archaeon]